MHSVYLLIVAGLLTWAASSEPANAQRRSRDTWQVSRVSDPITGSQTCVVAAYDRAAGRSFSRVGYLYPIVENNPQFGFLVGVSSGGRVRIPTGDILWRVDTNPYREIRAADNPAPPPATPSSQSNDPASAAMRDALAMTASLTMAATATSTVASGERAREMLREMTVGRQLIYRAAAGAPAYGLPSSAIGQVGQITREGLRPIPIDESFHRALAECGIARP
jgi:hypothetical protein